MKLVTISELDELKAVREKVKATPIYVCDCTNCTEHRLSMNEDDAALDAYDKYESVVNPQFVSRLEETLRRAIGVIEAVSYACTNPVGIQNRDCLDSIQESANVFLASVNSAADSSEGKNEGDTKYIENIKNAAAEVSSWPQWKVDSMKAYFSETITDNESSNESGDV